VETGSTGGEGAQAYVREAPGLGGFRFPRGERLKGRDGIREVFRRRKVFSCAGAKLFTLGNGLPYNRIAFTFPSKFGNAVERNRSRRLSREAYRLLRHGLRGGYDLVLLVQPPRGAKHAAFSDRMDQLRYLFSKAGLLSPSLGR
jgi:ribonuclease P protein component